MALSLDLRERILKAVEDGESRRGIARRFSVSKTTVQNLVNAYRATQSLEPGKPTGRKPRISPEHKQAIAQLVLDKPDILRRDIRRGLNLNCSEQRISAILLQLGFTRKKSRSGPRSRSEVT